MRISTEKTNTWTLRKKEPSAPDLASHPELISDVALAAAIVLRSNAALGEAFRRHSPVLRVRAQRSLQDQSQAQDVVQELFLQFYEHAERFDPDRASLRSYLLMLVRSRSIDLVRSDRARRVREETARRGELETVDDVALEVEDRWVVQELEGALGLLSEEHRQVVSLAYYSGLTYKGVASYLGLPEGTVKSRIRSGLKQLRCLI